MEKTLGKEYTNRIERVAFLKDNCDACENKGYMKAYTPEELQGHKENLANVSIEIDEIEEELKDIKAEYKERLKPLIEQRKTMVANIKQKSEYVNEVCYKFVDADEKMSGYYNADGDLIECRPATADELQPTLFSRPALTTNVGDSAKTGTND